MKFHRLLPGLLALSLLAGCASTTRQVGDAAQAPLRDLNVVKQEIPPLLQAAQQAPYALPAERGCAELRTAVKAFDEVLGPDLDAPPEADPSLGERGQAEVGKALQRTAEGVVPFRGWVRKLSGAERQERRVARAIEAGEARRAFLRGLLAGQGC